MSETHTTTGYIITIDRPSRSKCPNAWIALDETPNWIDDGTWVPEGAQILIGGDVRRATRIEKVRTTWTADEEGTFRAWGGAGNVTFTAADEPADG